MNYKKMLVLPALLLSCSQAYAQTCSNTQIETVFSGTQFGTLIQAVDRSCGTNGFICLDAIGDLDQTSSNRVYAAALTAQATDATVTLSWDVGNRGCGAAGLFPVATDLRILSAQ